MMLVCITYIWGLLVRITYTWVLFFMHILFVVNHTFNAMLNKCLQQYQLTFTPVSIVLLKNVSTVLQNCKAI